MRLFIIFLKEEAFRHFAADFHGIEERCGVISWMDRRLYVRDRLIVTAERKGNSE